MSQAVDQETLEMLKEVMEDDFQELIETFLNDADVQLPLFPALLAANNAEELRRVAHSLKGSSGNLGAQNLSSICLQIEHFAKSGETASIGPLLPTLEEEYVLVKQTLRDALND